MHNMQRAASHKWLRAHFPLRGVCSDCGAEKRTHRAYRLHPKPYTKNPDDYIELCPKCHAKFDGYFGKATHAAQAATST